MGHVLNAGRIVMLPTPTTVLPDSCPILSAIFEIAPGQARNG
jgi:hypothetical protein